MSDEGLLVSSGLICWPDNLRLGLEICRVDGTCASDVEEAERTDIVGIDDFAGVVRLRPL